MSRDSLSATTPNGGAPRHPRAAAADILAAIADIEGDSAGEDLARADVDRRVRQLVERNLGIVAQASRTLPSSVKASEAGIDWPALAALGDSLRDEAALPPAVLSHACTQTLPPLKSAVQRIWMKLSER